MEISSSEKTSENRPKQNKFLLIHSDYLFQPLWVPLQLVVPNSAKRITTKCNQSTTFFKGKTVKRLNISYSSSYSLLNIMVIFCISLKPNFSFSLIFAQTLLIVGNKSIKFPKCFSINTVNIHLNLIFLLEK